MNVAAAVTGGSTVGPRWLWGNNCQSDRRVKLV